MQPLLSFSMRVKVIPINTMTLHPSQIITEFPQPSLYPQVVLPSWRLKESSLGSKTGNYSHFVTTSDILMDIKPFTVQVK